MVIQEKYFTIREIDRSEIEHVYEVYKECEDFLALGPVAIASRQMVLDDLELSEEEGGTYCGIYLQDKMIGVVDFVRNGFEGERSNAHLSLLMLASGYRSKGIGADVVHAVEREIAKDQSVNSIYAGVQINNEAAIRFWQRMGYKIISEPQVMPDTTITYQLLKEIR